MSNRHQDTNRAQAPRLPTLVKTRMTHTSHRLAGLTREASLTGPLTQKEPKRITEVRSAVQPRAYRAFKA